MPTPLFATITRSEIEAELIRRGGTLFGYVTEGKASSGSASTLVDITTGSSGLSRFLIDADPNIIGKWVMIFLGTRQGDFVVASTFTTGTKTIVPLPNFGGAVDNTSQYIIWSANVFMPPQLTRFIRTSMQQLTLDKKTMRGLMLNVVEGREIQIGNALLNPLFDLYTTPNAPDSWTTTNLTVAMSTTVTYGGARRALRCLTDGANICNLTQNAPLAVGRQHTQAVTVWAWVYCTTAGELYLRVSQNAGATVNDSALHSGTGWEKLSVTATIHGTNVAAGLGPTVSAAIRNTTAGISGFYFWVQNIWFPKTPTDEHVYDLNANLALLAIEPRLRMSGLLGDTGGDAGNFKRELRGDQWEIIYETTRKMRLKIGSEYNGCVLEYRGYASFTELTAAATVFSGTTGQVDAIIELAMHLAFLAAVGQPAASDIDTARDKVLDKYASYYLPIGTKVLENN